MLLNNHRCCSGGVYEQFCEPEHLTFKSCFTVSYCPASYSFSSLFVSNHVTHSSPVYFIEICPIFQSLFWFKKGKNKLNEMTGSESHYTKTITNPQKTEKALSFLSSWSDNEPIRHSPLSIMGCVGVTGPLSQSDNRAASVVLWGNWRTQETVCVCVCVCVICWITASP